MIQIQAIPQVYEYYIFHKLLLLIREGLHVNNGLTRNSNHLPAFLSFSNEFYRTLTLQTLE